MKSLTTKIYKTLLLALIAALASGNAWASVTINVKAPSAPHVYVWNSSQTPLNGAWPGDVVTDTKVVNGETYYTKTFNENTVSVIFAKDNSTQTGDFSGLTGEVFFHYDGETLAYGNLPDNATYESTGKFVYFVNSKDWSTVNCHVYNGNSTNTEAMTYIGDDKAGQKVYKWGPKSNLGFEPADVIFNNGSWADNGGVQTPSQSYTNGGYYVYSETNNGSNKRLDLVATIDASRITNTDTYFADSHFREGITKSIGVVEGAAFTPADYTILDLSYDSDAMTGKISNISGISYFTNLEELNISNNNISYGDITSLTRLKKIIAAGNSGLQGFGVNTPDPNSNPVLRISSSSVLEYVDVSNCDTYYLTALNNNCGTTLKTLIAANNPRFDYSTFNSCSVLEYLDFSNCGLVRDALKEDRFKGAGGANLKYLDVSNNSLLYNVYVKDKTGLETIIMKNCTAYDYGSFEYCTNLKHADFSGCTALASDMWNHIKPEVHTQLQYLNLSNGTTNVSGHTFSFPALDTLMVNNHSTITALNIDTHCPSIIDITNDTHLTNMGITNCGLTSLPTIEATGATALYKLDLSDNAFTDVPTTGISSLTTMVMNNNQLSDINVSESNIKYLYAQDNNFGSGDYTLPQTSLVGLDLGNNGFTKFKAENNTSLKSLALGGNNDLTEIELHGNTALTQTSPDGVIENDNGLYIKGLSGLQTLNIENSNFNKLGQQHSLQGVTALETLKARHNELTTFTNGVYELHTSSTDPVNYRMPDPTQSSLEYQVNLRYLDLAYNQLRDSVHLYRNTALTHLDVSYNRSIDGQLDPAAEPLVKTAEQKAAILEQKGRRWMKYGRVGNKTYGVNADDDQWTAHYTNLQAGRLRPFDLRKSEAVCDLNDTTGLYHLDLGKNVNLEWLDFSYTNIHNTAAGPTFMCPGWMKEDWVTDDDLSATIASGKNTTGRWYSSWHTYVYFIPCSKLKVIHADHNNLSGFGVRYFPELDTLTCSYMYGESALMRDYNGSGDLRYGMGNTGLQTAIRKFDHIDWTKVNNSTEAYGVVLTGPEENPSGNFPNKLKYYDISYSSFNEIRFYPGTADNGSLPYLEYIDVSGNPLNFTTHASNANYATTSKWNSLDVTYCPNIKTVLANDCSALPTVRAYNRDALTTLDLTNDPLLKTVYAQDNAVLPSITGLSTLTGLETLFAYNNTQFGGIDVSSNTALKNLWVSNIGASSIDVSHNAALEKLRVYDNSLEALNVASNPALTWLDFARNSVPSIDLSANAALQYFNCSNSVETLDDQSLAANSHNGGEADEVKPVTSSHSANDTGNSLSDLVFNASAPIADVRANSNDLHYINGSFANLTNIEFAHNHINGIDLAAASGLTPNKVVDDDNGRSITAECAKFYKKGDFNNIYTVYYFQLENIKGQQLTGKTSKDSKGTTRYLGEDGFALNKLGEWDGENAALYVPQTTAGISLKDATIDPSNMNNYLDGNVEGTVVVLKEDPEHPGEGTATYTYKTGVRNSDDEEDTSTFYLNWSSDGTVTGINDVKVNEGMSVAGSYGELTVVGADGTVVGVYDMSGRQVASETISGGKATITSLTPGIYVVNGIKVVVR